VFQISNIKLQISNWREAVSWFPQDFSRAARFQGYNGHSTRKFDICNLIFEMLSGDVLKILPRLETDRFTGRDFDLFPRAWISPNPSFPGFYLKDSESSQLNPLPIH